MFRGLYEEQFDAIAASKGVAPIDAGHLKAIIGHEMGRSASGRGVLLCQTARCKSFHPITLSVDDVKTVRKGVNNKGYGSRGCTKVGGLSFYQGIRGSNMASENALESKEAIRRNHYYREAFNDVYLTQLTKLSNLLTNTVCKTHRYVCCQ